MLDFQLWLVGLLVFARISSFTVAAPFFDIRGIPTLAKIGFAAVLTILVVPFVPGPTGFNGLLAYMLHVINEVLTGLLLGFAASLIFHFVRVGGELIDLQMGFAMARVMDPQGEAQVTLMGNLQYIFAILLFFTLNGHHTLIAALIKSFQLVPLATGSLTGGLVEQLVNIFVSMFALAFKIAAPVLAVLLISDLSLGLVARTVPQLNVFMLGFPLKAGLGMLVVALILPMLSGIVSDMLLQMKKDLLLIMRSLG
ncbi:MAG: flagellar type III secretion system protein FliR [Thermoanaerobacteraceae bacterium]|nr:flagellar type III secretion system protein FliR [Thermoanaerobacteraceae bacterium]